MVIVRANGSQAAELLITSDRGPGTGLLTLKSCAQGSLSRRNNSCLCQTPLICCTFSFLVETRDQSCFGQGHSSSEKWQKVLEQRLVYPSGLALATAAWFSEIPPFSEAQPASFDRQSLPLHHPLTPVSASNISYSSHPGSPKQRLESCPLPTLSRPPTDNSHHTTDVSIPPLAFC